MASFSVATASGRARSSAMGRSAIGSSREAKAAPRHDDLFPIGEDHELITRPGSADDRDRLPVGPVDRVAGLADEARIGEPVAEVDVAHQNAYLGELRTASSEPVRQPEQVIRSFVSWPLA